MAFSSGHTTYRQKRHHSASSMPPATRMVKAAAADRMTRAVEAGDSEAIKKMLGAGLHPDMVLRGSRRPLSVAVSQDDPAVFDTLVERGASLNPTGNARGNALFSCVRNEDVRGMNRMIAAGASAAETEGYVNSPPAENILFSIGTTNADVVRRLLDAGAWKSLEKTDGRNNTPVERMRKARAAIIGEKGEDYQPDLFDNNRVQVIGLMERYAELPRVDFDKGGFRKSDLFTPDAAGNTPFDHPETWNRWPEVAQELAKHGEKFTLEDLMKTDAKGKTWLERAVECWSLPQVVDTLNNQGEKLGSNHLLSHPTANGHVAKPSPLFELAREHHQLGAVFTEKNLNESPTVFNSLYAQLSESEKESIVPNAHAFRAQLGNPSTKGIGR